RFRLSAPIDDRRRAQRAAGLKMRRDARAIDRPREAHPRLEPELARERAQLARERSVAERDETEAGMPLAHARQRAQQHVESLLSDEPPREQHEAVRERTLGGRLDARAVVRGVDAG